MCIYNRRRSPRIPVPLTMLLTHAGVEHGTMVAQINEHGLFIRTHLALELGQHVRVSIDLPDGTVEAIVATRFAGETSDGHGIGVELHTISVGDRARWRRNYRVQLHRLAVERVTAEEAHG